MVPHLQRGNMGKRGPTSSAPGGYGTITPKGYRRVWDTSQLRARMEHDVIWERHNGPIPEGYDVHHIDRDKLNNNLPNLELMKRVDHKREHSGCKLIAGQMYKPCRKCGVFHPVRDYYKRKDGISPWCRPCCIQSAIENKRRRNSK